MMDIKSAYQDVRGTVKCYCVVTNGELILHSQHITQEIMGSLDLTGVAKPHAEHLLFFSMATPVSL